MRLCCIAVVACLFVCLTGAAHAEVPPIAGKAWIVTDFYSGTVLAEKNANQPLEPASLTKLMTAYLVFDALKKGELDLRSTPSFSVKAYQTGGARLPIDPKQPATVEQLLQGMITLSANDAAIQLAEAVAGTEERFVERMNQTAQRLQLTATRFGNASGRPMSGHVSSARDIALLAAALIRDFPQFYALYQTKSFVWRGVERSSHNLLLWRDPTVDGLKTGTTASAGYCLAASAKRGDRRVIAVLLGASSEEARAVEVQKLLNYGMQVFDTPAVYQAGQSLATVPVWEGTLPQVRVLIPQTVYLTVPAGQGPRLKASLLTPQPMLAPLRKGQKLGQVNISLDGKVIGSYPVVAGEAIPASGWWGRTIDRLRLWWSKP